MFRSLARLRSSFLMVLLFIQLLLIVLSALFGRIAVSIISQQEEKKVLELAKFVDIRLKEEVQRMVIPSLTMAGNKDVIQLFETRERAKLYSALKDTFSELSKRGLKQLQFNTPDLKVFLRAHNPDHFGDDLSVFRPTVVIATKERKQVEGLEQGKSGYGFRAVVPLFDSNNGLIGTMEFGSSLDEKFMKQLAAQNPGKWMMYNLARNVSSDNKLLVASSGLEESELARYSVPPPTEAMDELTQGKVFSKFDQAQETITVWMPIRNFNQDIALIAAHEYHTDFYARLREIIFLSALVAFAGLLVSALIISVLYKQITNPLRALVVETEKIKKFQLDEPISIPSRVTEITDVIDAVAQMKTGLQSFKKYVPAQLVRDLMATNQEASIGGSVRQMTVFFSDIANFTEISEQLRPSVLAKYLSEYLELMTGQIMSNHGTVDKYIGDAVMAFWGAPAPLPNHAHQACLAALRCRDALAQVARQWKAEDRPLFRTRMGINTGDLIVGNMGSPQRLSYTVIGDAVNLASRLESLNKVYGTEILISDETYAACGDAFETRLIDFVVVKGKTEAVQIRELIAEKGDIAPTDLEFIRAFEYAAGYYQRRDWEKALQLFQNCLQMRPEDRPSNIFLERCQGFLINPPPNDWTGVIVLREK